MVMITNYGSGEIVIQADGGASLRLPRDKSHRLIMTARMHSVSEFLEKVPNLIDCPELCVTIAAAFAGKDGSARWGLKEKFARLTTLAKGYLPSAPDEILETASL
jgi:hypothetical protein